MAQDLFNTSNRLMTLTPLERNADVESTGYNRLNYASVVQMALIGITADTLSGSIYIDVFLEHSTDNSVWSAVTVASYVTGTMLTLGTGLLAHIDDNAEDDVLVDIEYKGPNQYTRLRFDFVGTHTTGTELAVISQGAFPRFQGRNQHSDAGTAGA